MGKPCHSVLVLYLGCCWIPGSPGSEPQDLESTPCEHAHVSLTLSPGYTLYTDVIQNSDFLGLLIFSKPYGHIEAQVPSSFLACQSLTHSSFLILSP